MFNIHLRVIDANTKQPTACRIRIADSTGRSFPPLGRLAEFAIGRNEDVGGQIMLDGKRWYYIDGGCETPLPAKSPLTVEINKGPEFLPIRREISLGAGQMTLRFEISRCADSSADRWYSGDTRCHFLSPHSAMLEAMGEDLDVVNLLATETSLLSHDGMARTAIPNMTAFSGQQPALDASGRLVAVNTLNCHPVLGKLALLHCHRAVFPLSFGGTDSTDDWSLADWCDQCHRKKGLVIWADPFRFEKGIGGEALADLILGRIDAAECTPESAWIDEWYRAWSAGIRFPIAGASGKESNRIALGAMRTYARLNQGETLTLANWIEAVRAGRTFVTDGPLLRFEVDQNPAGSLIEQKSPGGSVWVRARVESARPFGTLELLANGQSLIRISATDSEPPFHAMVEMEHPVQEPCWLAARCTGADSFTHSSPVFVSVDGRMPADDAAIRHYLELLGGALQWVESSGRFEKPLRKQQLRAVIEQARQTLLSRLPT